MRSHERERRHRGERDAPHQGLDLDLARLATERFFLCAIRNRFGAVVEVAQTARREAESGLLARLEEPRAGGGVGYKEQQTKE